MRKYLTHHSKWYGAFLLVIALFLIAVIGCQGPAGEKGSQGPPGIAGPPGASTGTVSGKITANPSNVPVGNVAVTTDPVIQGVNITSNAGGDFSATLPVGVYTFTFKKDNFETQTATVSVVAGQTTSKNIALKLLKPVAVSAGTNQTSAPGATVTLKATATPYDGSTVSGYEWVQTAGPKATIDNAKSDTIKVTLGNAQAYKAELIKGMELHDRFMVQPISPHALTAAKTATFKVTATASSGKYTATVNVVANLPYVFTTGIQNVPKDVPVLLHGKTQNGYNWTISAPTGSKAAFDNASDQNPTFVPDVVGKYVITEKTSGATIDVYAGTWAGAISGADEKGQPLAAGCTACHNGTIAADNFSDWKKSGHSIILTKNLNNPNGHWTENCAACHTVGYNTAAANGGFDEAAAAEGWKAPPSGSVGYWNNTMLSKYPKTAKLGNIQCENCHGPNDGSTLHANKKIDSERISLASDVCGACHGEPPRHGRFQQWEESGHGNFELAIADATVESRGATAAHCGRCHTAQGFLAWIKQGDLTKQIQGAKGNATVDELKALGLTKDTVQPQTCVVCHDPHNPGASSGEPNTATVRIMDNTLLLPAGFKAEEVGRGAICMTCHNTRNALHNNDFAPNSYSAPHTAAQADVLMGENAYFVNTKQRSPHSYVKDTCATCHMEKTPPPAEFSYQQSGTNHSFKASLGICSSCHTDTFNAEALKIGMEGKLHELGEKMSAYLLNKMPAKVTILDYTPHAYGGKNYDLKSAAIVLDKSNIASLEPTEPHGQQGFLIKFKNPVNATYSPAGESPHTMSLKEAEVQLGDITTDGTAKLIAVTDPLVKAGWNYFLVHGDNSGGIHNPEFVEEVLEAAINALR